MTKYYTLLTRDCALSLWGIAFGDYDLTTVKFERDDCLTHMEDGAEMRIITTTDAQADIDAAVAALNGVVTPLKPTSGTWPRPYS